MVGEGEKSFVSVVLQCARCLTSGLHCGICGVVCILFNLYLVYSVVGESPQAGWFSKGRSEQGDRLQRGDLSHAEDLAW